MCLLNSNIHIYLYIILDLYLRSLVAQICPSLGPRSLLSALIMTGLSASQVLVEQLLPYSNSKRNRINQPQVCIDYFYKDSTVYGLGYRDTFRTPITARRPHQTETAIHIHWSLQKMFTGLDCSKSQNRVQLAVRRKRVCVLDQWTT